MSTRFIVAAAAGIVAGVLSENPYTGYQVFAGVPMIGPFRVKDQCDAGDPAEEGQPEAARDEGSA